MSLVRNEQAKLTANYLNGVAIAVFAVRVISSLPPGLNDSHGVTVVTSVLVGVFIVASAAPHWVARQILRGLKE